MSQIPAVAHTAESVPATNKVVRNTYMLLSMTLLFSALCAGFAMVNGAPLMNIWIVLAVFIGGPFVLNAFRNSAWSLLLVFVFTGFMGYVLGPIVGLYLQLPNGSQIVMSAMATTGAVFIGLSAYALTTRRDFSFIYTPVEFVRRFQWRRLNAAHFGWKKGAFWAPFYLGVVSNDANGQSVII
jgi:modulator of FtsH protease